MDGASKNQTITAAEGLLRALKRRGVDHVLANAGTDFAPIIEGLVRASGRRDAIPRFITVPHENLAMAMAHGYYQVAGKPAGVMVHVTVGTGNTTVTVNMFEYRFDLSQASVPSGQVTFVVTNKGEEVHNFDLVGVKVGALLAPGQTETWTVSLPAKGYTGVCDVPFHIDRGMTTSFTVTP